MIKNKIQLLRFLVQFTFFIFTIVGLLNVPLMLGFAAVSAIILGPVFCGWMCVFGAFQDWINYIGIKLKLKQFKIPLKVHNILKYSRYLIYIGLVTIGGVFIYFGQIRMSYIFSIGGSVLIDVAFWSFIVVGIIALFTKRFYCKYLCPTGAMYGLYSLVRPITINRSDKCIQCNKCNNICPMQIPISSKKSLSSPNCINCYQCVEVCPVSCLSVGVRHYKFN